MAGNFFKTPTQAELEAAFDYFDSDKSGFISEEGKEKKKYLKMKY